MAEHKLPDTKTNVNVVVSLATVVFSRKVYGQKTQEVCVTALLEKSIYRKLFANHYVVRTPCDYCVMRVSTRNPEPS
ncbi:MAG: hypothetical protein WCW14_03150 [Candidatus Paceibacterota bacterium]